MASDRILKLTEKTMAGEMFAHPKKTEYDRLDNFLSKKKKSAKRVCEYILNQEPIVTEYITFYTTIKSYQSCKARIFRHDRLLIQNIFTNPLGAFFLF